MHVPKENNFASSFANVCHQCCASSSYGQFFTFSKDEFANATPKIFFVSFRSGSRHKFWMNKSVVLPCNQRDPCVHHFFFRFSCSVQWKCELPKPGPIRAILVMVWPAWGWGIHLGGWEESNSIFVAWWAHGVCWLQEFGFFKKLWGLGMAQVLPLRGMLKMQLLSQGFWGCQVAVWGLRLLQTGVTALLFGDTSQWHICRVSSPSKGFGGAFEAPPHPFRRRSDTRMVGLVPVSGQPTLLGGGAPFCACPNPSIVSSDEFFVFVNDKPEIDIHFLNKTQGSVSFFWLAWSTPEKLGLVTDMWISAPPPVTRKPKCKVLHAWSNVRVLRVRWTQWVSSRLCEFVGEPCRSRVLTWVHTITGEVCTLPCHPTMMPPLGCLCYYPPFLPMETTAGAGKRAYLHLPTYHDD